mgnify:CR=1 FL=1
MDEKRGFTRFSFNKKIMLQTDAGNKFAVEIENLSLKGGSIRVTDQREFEPGSHFAFTMIFHDDEDITVKGDAYVLWRKDDTYGLRFENMGSDYFMNLKRLLELNYSDEK